MIGWKQKIIDCLDSFLCLESEVEKRVNRIHMLLDRKLPFEILTGMILAQANGIVSLCGALSERPVECMTDVIRIAEQSVNREG